MSDHDPTVPASSGDSAGPSASAAEPPVHPIAPTWLQRRSRWSRLEIVGVLCAALLGVGVAVLALDMKFEADQARWQQRQTCLEWYRLQADYGVGPWYQKLPAAAADCGGAVDDDELPRVPGGTGPAVEPGDGRYEPAE